MRALGLGLALALAGLLAQGCGREAADATPLESIDRGDALAVLAHSEGVVVVDMYASWCGTCRMQMPIVESVAQEFRGRARFVKVDIGRGSSLPAALGMSAIPTYFVYRDGREVDRLQPSIFVGLRLRHMIAAALP